MPEHTWDALGKLGIGKAARQNLYGRLSKLAINSFISCVNTRRREETRGSRDGKLKCESGYVRVMKDKADKSKEARKERTAGYRNKKRPRKGEG